MTHDDETVERVARAIYEAAPNLTRVPSLQWGAGPYTDTRDAIPPWDEVCADAEAGSGVCRNAVEAVRKAARAALSAMPPRELLREALEALDEIEDDLGCPPSYYGATSMAGHYCPNCDRSLHSTRDRARAAADKIRAALTQEKQT